MKRALPGLRAHAVACLSRREYSRAELRTRLLAHARKLAEAALWVDPSDQTTAADGARPAGAAAGFAAPPGDHGTDLADGLPARLRALAGAHQRSSERFDAEAMAAEVDEVLDWLASRQLQSDARFVESRVHARAARHGQARIRQELARHGVELDADTARQLRETELDRARQVWQARFGETASDAADRARQMRFLAARGFSGDVIRRLVGGRDDE